MKKENHILKEKLFKYFLFGNTMIIAILFGAILYSLISESQLSIEKYSFKFLYDDVWQPLISSDEQTVEPFISMNTAIATDNNSSCYLALSTSNSSQNVYENIEFKIYTEYDLQEFSSTNLSRRTDIAVENIILKDSAGAIYDITDAFDLQWDYLSQHNNNYFNIQLIPNDTLSVLPNNATLLAVIEFEAVDINSSDFKNSWSFAAHNVELDGYVHDKIKHINTSSFEDLISEDIDDDSLFNVALFNGIDTTLTSNLSIKVSSGDFEDEDAYQIFGNAKPSEKYGALPYIICTIITSILALLLATPFALAIAIFLGEYFRNYKIATILKSLIDLISAIPSVIYGFWGLVILVPITASIGERFGINSSGISILSASVILAFMIIPYMATISAEVIKMVPTELKEAAYGLGATRFDVIRKVILPHTKSGIISGIILSLGRALGETMAVTMLIGNVTGKIVTNLFDPSNTMATIIANNFAEAGSTLFSSLIEIALLLFILTSIISFVGRYYIRKGVING